MLVGGRVALDEIGAPGRRAVDGSELLSLDLIADAIGDSNRDCVSKSNSIK